ncbi:hypothetical protein UlMin_007809 [Ulmus minor]
MQTLKISPSVCSNLDAMIRRFWWSSSGSNKPLCLKAWREVCQPKQWGGLGFRKMRDLNCSMLAKWAWNLMKGHNSLCCSVLQACYLLHKKFSYATAARGDSPFWKSIVVAKNLVMKGACFLVGNAYLTDNADRFKEVPGIIKSDWNKLWSCRTILPQHKILWWQLLTNSLPNGEGNPGKSILLFASILSNLLWKLRNDKTRGGAPLDPTLLFQNITRSYNSLFKTMAHHVPMLAAVWEPPPNGQIKVIWMQHLVSLLL